MDLAILGFGLRWRMAFVVETGGFCVGDQWVWVLGRGGERRLLWRLVGFDCGDHAGDQWVWVVVGD